MQVNTKAIGRTLLAMTAAWFLAGSCFAQTVHRCVDGSTTYLSDRPCVGGMTSLGGSGRAPAGRGSDSFGVYGAAPSGRANPPPPYIAPMAKAPDYLAYLSSGCSQIHEAIRTGPARGLRSSTLSDLHGEYQSKCADEDRAARQRVSQEQQRDRDEKRSQAQADQAERKRIAVADEQCSEMLRILHGKRQRADAMTAGERADLQRGEASYAERCPRYARH